MDTPDPANLSDDAGKAQRRLELLTLLSEPGRFDFEAVEHAWGGDHEQTDWLPVFVNLHA